MSDTHRSALPEPSEPPSAPDVVCGFGHTPTAAEAARRAVRQLRLDEGLAGDVELVASELVTNVVLHTEDGGEIRAWDDDPVRLEVQDTSASIPTERSDAPVGGRGLQIVDQLTTRWGTRTVGCGKVVWAIFSRRPR